MNCKLIVKNADGTTKVVVLNSSVHADLPDAVEAGKPFTIQLAPKGEYPQFVDDPEKPGEQKQVVQILDDQAIETLVGNFKDPVLVDADHSSETSTNTKAMAWVKKLFIDADKGLMAEIEPTPLGADAINGKVYRFVSGAWTLDDDGRPVELVSIGLTNKPNLPVKPMINAQAGKEKPGAVANNAADGVTVDNPSVSANADDKGKQTDANPDGSQNTPAATAANADNGGDNHQGENQMNLKQKLGLPEEATDAEVEQALDALIARANAADGAVAAVNSINEALGLVPAEEGGVVNAEDTLLAVNQVINACGELQAKNAEVEKAKLNAEAEQLVADNADVIPEDDVEAVKEQYCEDPEKCKAAVANMRKVYDRAVLNAAKAAAPKVERVVIKNAQAKKPEVALNMQSIMAECGGDPAKMNAAIAKMAKQA